jgi:hypothetical protein
MAHGDAQEGKWRGNWWMEWVASTLHTTRNVVYPAILTLMCMPRLPAVDWTDALADLHGLVRFGERWNLVSACVLSHFKCSLPPTGMNRKKNQEFNGKLSDSSFLCWNLSEIWCLCHTWESMKYGHQQNLSITFSRWLEKESFKLYTKCLTLICFKVVLRP